MNHQNTATSRQGEIEMKIKLGWTVSTRYQDGRGFCCVDVYFNGSHRYTQVSGCPLAFVGYDDDGCYWEIPGEWETWVESV